MEKKITREELIEGWEEILKKHKPEAENEFSKPIQDFIFNTIIDAPKLEIKPIHEE